ncbi:hypothetical protein L1049_012665 [Liquidambar formosana]|uniref:Peptidase S9A N-terminal domain-containing protein n=1 Tax=Liquidambar formosana TaxID=63359 RepID=A0AAP0N556_LIQFO
MALLSLLNRRCSIKRSSFSLNFHLIPAISPSSFFSSLCRRANPSFTVPSQNPPVPKKLPFTVSAHGRTWQDPYHWMSNTDDPDLTQYLNHENSYAEAFMADTKNLQRTLFSEMTSRMPAKISTPPERWGPWLYHQYIPEGKEYPVLCRRLGTESKAWVKTILNYVGGFGREEILLDWNEVAKEYGYVHVGTCRVSPDHNFLAYTLDISGDERFILQVKDLRRCSVQNWDQMLLMVSRYLQKVIPASVWTSQVQRMVYVIDATNPQDGLRRIHKRVPGVQYFLEHHYGFFYVLTNAPLCETKFSCGDFYLARCRVEDIQSGDWQNIILPGEDISFKDMDIFNGHLVLFLDAKGFPMICSIDMPIDVNCKHQLEIDNLNPWFFPLPSNLCGIVPGSNHDFMNSVYRVVLSSPVMPDIIVDYDMSQQKLSIVNQEEVLGVSSNTGSCLPSYDPNMNKLLDAQNSSDTTFT